MEEKVKLLDVIALTESIPERGIQRGQVGTIVEELGPETFEVEFSDQNGRTYQTLTLRTDQLLILHHEQANAA
jgi:hypothetical protein